MVRKSISIALILAGLVMVMGGMGALIPPSSASAQTIPQPTPRPPLPPEDDGDDSSSAATMGHITGTIIDQVTGAPLPNVKVFVGDLVILTDANGNYDLWIETGTYLVTIESSTTPVPAVEVILPAGERVVQHFVRPAARAAAAEPTAVPTEPAPVAAPTAAPLTLDPTVGPAEVVIPARLPHTAGNPLVLFSAWFWVSLGAALIAGGVFVGLRADSLRTPARALASYARHTPNRSGDAAAFLAALLTTEIRAATPNDDTLLQALLATDTTHRRAAQEILAELLSKPVHA